jgi:tetratricopeptide (TPR) repeat protein
MTHGFRAVLLVTLSGIATAQIPPAELNATMQMFTQALGVNCGFCHSAERGSGQPEPKKEIARAMLAMTRDINAKVQAATGKPAADAATVSCVTCHHGVSIPRQLSEIMTRTLREKGSDAAIAQYRELRQRYAGTQSYDFSDATLVGVATQIANARPGDAIALLQLNLEFSPRSSATYAELSYAYTRKLDDDSAITAIEKALEIEPENGVYRGQLEQLKSYQRARQRRQQ